jgi:ABC-type antimicrobial peptide transport system permease subunit
MNLLIREGNNYITDDVMERNRLGSLASIIDYENEKLKYGYNRNDSLFLFDIYGYDSDTIENLNIYLKEGSINIEQLESAKEIIIITQNRKMVPFNLGDEIEFTQLIYGATSYNNLPTKIIFQTKIAGIAVVDSSAKDIVVPNEYAFVFSHESFSEVGIKANYTNIYIALKDSAKYEDIERTIDIVKEINPLIKIESARTIRENLNDVRESVNAVNAIYVAIISVFAFINLLIVIHNRYKRRRKIYALIRILGVSKKELTMVTFIENAVIAFVSWVIGYSIGIISCKMLSDGSKVWMRYLPIGGIVIMLACVIIAIMFLSFRYANKFYKENIIESIRYIG